jgi:hypothetical protein
MLMRPQITPGRALAHWPRFTAAVLSLAVLPLAENGGEAWAGQSVPHARPAAAQFQNQAGLPDIDGGIAWLNSDKELRLADLRGRVVLLDFWTLC